MPKAIILNSSQYESVSNCPDPAWDTCEYDGGGCSDSSGGAGDEAKAEPP